MKELKSVVIAAQQGDHDAFATIVARFQNMAYASAYAMLGDSGLAQDAAQEAFIDAYQSLPKLQEPAAFPGWFRRIVFKHSDRQIRRKRLPTVDIDDIAVLAPSWSDPVIWAERAELQQTMAEAITALPQQQRLVTTLFYVQGYSQKEIGQFLELPVSTIKKRLFTARKLLKKRMITMLQEHLQENKPSQSDAFAIKVKFFVALRAGKLTEIKTLVAQYPHLIHIKTEYDISSQGFYWPLGVTPLYWAAGVGDIELLTFLVSQGAKLDDTDPSGFTPLHHAVLLRQTGSVKWLLQQGAALNVATNRGFTPLHLAVIRHNTEIVLLLLQNGVDATLTDERGYFAADWARLMGFEQMVELLQAQDAPFNKLASPPSKPDKPTREPAKRTVPAGAPVLGRILNQAGQPMDGLPALPTDAAIPLYCSTTASPSEMLETGIKIIDLFAPLKRGGHNAIFTPLAGVGHVVLLNQLIYRMAAFYNGYIVYLGQEAGEYTAESLILAWRGEFGQREKILEERMVHIFGQRDDAVEQRQQLVETGLTVAEQFRQQGHDVLFVVPATLALTDGVLPLLKATIGAAATGAITVLYDGNFSLGAEPVAFAFLDSVITFERERAVQRLYPAVDPLRSRSRLLQFDAARSPQAQLVETIRKMLYRYRDLHPQIERYGLDSLFYLEQPQADEIVVRRARRLHRFFSQPFYGTEPWTGLAGEYVSLADAIAGCQAIFEGQADELPEEALSYIGTLQQAQVTKG